MLKPVCTYMRLIPFDSLLEINLANISKSDFDVLGGDPETNIITTTGIQKST